MSIVFDAAADRLKITTSTLLWTTGNPYTQMGWFNINALTGGLQSFFPLLLDNVTAYVFMGTLSTGALYYENSSGSSYTGSVLSLSTWYHVAFTYTPGGNCFIYLNGTVQNGAGSTANSLAGTPDQQELGGWRTTNGNRLDGSIAAVKFWNRALSGAEVAAEVNFAAPQTATSLYGYWYLNNETDYLDQSGNGHDWSVLGTLTAGANPPGVSGLNYGGVSRAALMGFG